jgi:hypothetical protein
VRQKGASDVTSKFPFRELIRFLAWLLNPNNWPWSNAKSGYLEDLTRTNSPSRQATGALTSLTKKRSSLDLLSLRYPNSKLRGAIEQLHEAEEVYRQQGKLHYYDAAHGAYVTGPGMGNVEYQRMIFYAWLILKMLHISKWFRQQSFCSGDRTKMIIAFLEDKHHHTYTEAKITQDLHRYRQRQDELPPAHVIWNLYDRYLLETLPTNRRGLRRGLKRLCYGPTREERMMLKSLADLASATLQRKSLRKTRRSDGVKPLEHPLQRRGRGVARVSNSK